MAVPVVVDMGGVSVSSRTHLRDVNTGLRIARTSHVPLALGQYRASHSTHPDALWQYPTLQSTHYHTHSPVPEFAAK